MERERFLDVVRERLGRTRSGAAPVRSAPVAPFPSVDGELVERFSTELEKVGGTMSRAATKNEALERLTEALSTAAGGAAIGAGRAEFEALGFDTTAAPFDRLTFFGEGAASTAEGFRTLALGAAVGLTTVRLAIAATGTLVLAATASSPRSLSLLPRRHVALVHEAQLVPHFGGALVHARERSGAGVPSALFCVTGPSRTSDIENDLSIGVHGPAEVHVLLLGFEQHHAKASGAET